MATNVNELDLPTFDPASLVDRDESRRLLADARRRHWLARTPLGYMITHYDDVVAMLRDRRLHQLARILAELNGVTDERFLARRRTSILTAEGDEHSRLRRLVAPAFTPKSADRFRPFMRAVIDSLVDEVAPRGRCDFVSEVCEPYPIPIICELLGAPKEDWKLFSRWAPDVLRVLNGNMVEDLPVIMQAQDELNEYVRDLVAVRRQQPGDDLLTDLIAAEEAGDRLSTDELVMLAEAVLIAGTDTTRNQLALAVAMFARHPDQWALLVDQPELAPRAVEESMRILGAVRSTGRIVPEDVVYRDVLFPAGTLVFPGLLAGNLDPDTFEAPDRFDITRQGGAAQLTFGSGIHVCLGAALARAELQEALPLLARRMPGLRLDAEIAWKPNTVGIWGPERLPIAFDAGH